MIGRVLFAVIVVPAILALGIYLVLQPYLGGH